MQRIIKEEQIKEIVKQVITDTLKESLLNEIQKKIDNFSKRAAFIDAFNQKNGQDNDKVWFIQIMIRKKDNPNLDLKTMYPGQYHAGAVYGNFSNSTAFLVHTGDELLALKQQIVDYCDKNNARAVIWLNPRSETAVQKYLPIFRKGLTDKHGKPLPVTDPRYVNALELLYGQCKFDRKNFADRKFCKYDIDTDNKTDQNFAIRLIKSYTNIPDDYIEPTASGGLHIICPDQYAPYMKELSKYLRMIDARVVKDNSGKFVVDKYPDLGFQQTAHFNEDANTILYANVNTPGY